MKFVRMKFCQWLLAARFSRTYQEKVFASIVKGLIIAATAFVTIAFFTMVLFFI